MNLPLFLFLEPFEDALRNQTAEAALSKSTSTGCTSPLLSRAADWTVAEDLSIEPWYQGEMSRKEAEQLLKKCGDFLVRKSTTNPGSYVLTGMHNGQAKHLLLVDPEGTVSADSSIIHEVSDSTFSLCLILFTAYSQLIISTAYDHN